MNKLIYRLLLAVIIFGAAGVIIFPAHAEPESPTHLVPAYATDHYVVGGALDVFTQQVCLGVHDQRVNHEHAVDYGLEGEAVISHSIAVSQPFNGTINVGRLQSWGYTVDRVRTLGDASYSVLGDLLTIQATPPAALNIQLRGETCLFRFPFAYLDSPSRALLPITTKDN